MVKPIRRVVAGNDDRGIAVALSDGPSPDVRLDPARPGFALTRLWVQNATPARVKGVRETLHLPHTLEPPPNGSLCRAVEYPPEKGYIDRITPTDVRAYFASMGSPGASTASAGTPHPYMQRTSSLDFCFILEGEITLVLDTIEVPLKEGDSVILRGANHAWSNRSDKPCVIVMSQHDATLSRAGKEAPVETGKAINPDAKVRPLRRVVTGHDAQRRSGVAYDSNVPNYFPRVTGTCFYELWTFEDVPVALGGNADAGAAGRPFLHSPPANGAHWRITHSPAKKIEVASAQQKAQLEAANSTGGTQRLDGAPHEGMHRTPSVDYAILLEGERHLVLEESDVLLHKGDVVIQLGNWHTWDNRSGFATLMSYVMIGGEFAA
jgi:quercetin dioxygenase-like cupin family protein